MANLPYQAEYAKSGRATCKGCKQKIDHGTLRIAVIVQSAVHDGMQSNWHHKECFFKKHRPTTAADISKFNRLKHTDQMRVKETIENYTGIVKSEKKTAKKRATDADGATSSTALEDFRIEYSKSSRATCCYCENNVCKDEVRVCKVVFDTEVGAKYGGQPLWHHVKCFNERRSALLYFAGGESLPGFLTLTKDDQAIVKSEIKSLMSDDVSVKKLKAEPKDEAELQEDAQKEKEQNELLHEHRSTLNAHFEKQDLEALLEQNSQQIPAGRDERRLSLSNLLYAEFFTLIPHDFGTQNAPLLDNLELVKKKAEMIDNLLEIKIVYSLLKTDSDESTSPIESHYTKLKADISPLDKNSDEFKLIEEYTRNTHAATHSSYTLDIQEVFKVVREGEEERYKPLKKLHNRRLLWHGSRVTNFAGILSQGLRIAPPEAPVAGYMFGKGIYFADMVSKSANYCATKKSNPTGLMLLCEVALGNMKECYNAENVNLPADKHSAWGVGRTEPDPTQSKTLPCGTLVPCGTPVDKQVATSLLYNEFIVYDVAQVNVKYLLQLKFNHKY